jgi:protein-S-isoprenylcysteine O-methyltransferase Ste14
MGIGSSIALIAIGAIFAFALDFDVAGINITVIGYILMVAGALGLLFTALIFGRRSETVVERPRRREIVREREIDR